MAYEKLNLEDGVVLNAEHMAHIEEGISKSVSCDVQTLTEEQKKQARHNIGFEVAKFAYNEEDDTITCLTHTASELVSILSEKNTPVIGFVIYPYDQEYKQTRETYFVYLQGFYERIFVGNVAADWGWWHSLAGDESFYVDGNSDNKTIGNEIWFAV